MNLTCSNCEFFKPVENLSRGRCSSPAIIESYGEDQEYHPRANNDGWCPVHKPKDVK